MQITRTEIPEVLIIEPAVFTDHRGFFLESFNAQALADAAGITLPFVQDNHSFSLPNVLRGLHYQIQQPQGKLLRVVRGEIFDIAVDLRRSAPTFGQHVATRLSAQNKRIFWIPPGFAHGFLVLSDGADVLYKATAYYAPQLERTLLWNDPALAIPWPLHGQTPTLSPKDQAGKPLTQADLFP